MPVVEFKSETKQIKSSYPRYAGYLQNRSHDASDHVVDSQPFGYWDAPPLQKSRIALDPTLPGLRDIDAVADQAACASTSLSAHLPTAAVHGAATWTTRSCASQSTIPPCTIPIMHQSMQTHGNRRVTWALLSGKHLPKV